MFKEFSEEEKSFYMPLEDTEKEYLRCVSNLASDIYVLEEFPKENKASIARLKKVYAELDKHYIDKFEDEVNRAIRMDMIFGANRKPNERGTMKLKPGVSTDDNK